MSGSAATRLRKVGHGLLGIEQALVHVDVDDLGAGLDLLARHRQRGGIVARGDQLAEFGRAGDVGPLADVDEGDRRRQLERLQSGQPQPRLVAGTRAACAGDGLGDRRDMVGRGAAAAAQDVDEAGVCPFADQPRRISGLSSYSPKALGRPALG